MKRPLPDPNQHSLRREHLDQLRHLLMLKAHHQAIIQSLDAQVATLLNIGYGADINNEEWVLDMDKGVLSRANTDRLPQQ